MDSAALHSLAIAHRSEVQAFAGSWLAAGATSVSLWVGATCVTSWPEQADVRHTGLRVPVCVRGVPVGAVGVDGLSGAATEARLRADAQWIAYLLQLETELNGMTAELIEAQDQLLALYELSRSMRRYVTLPETLEALAGEAARLVKVGGACVLVAHEGSLLAGRTPAVKVDPAALDGLFERVRSEPKTLLLVDGGALGGAVMNLCLEPIFVQGSCTAALALFNKAGGFSSPDLKLARAIAEQAGAQIENVLLYQQSLAQARFQAEMELATAVQLRLLPRELPPIAGLDLFASSHPASHVGGDFFDVIDRPGRAPFFVVGDVSGKGMSAALVMAMTRTVVRSKALFLPDPDPASVLARVNEDLYDDFSELGMFTTAFVCQFLLEGRALVYANAGHAPVLFCPVGGPAELLEADSTAIGVLPLSFAANQRLTLHPGDVLVLATDGFSEAAGSDGEMYGYERLMRLVEHERHGSAAEIGAAMFAACAAFSGQHPQGDDQTLIVIKGVPG